eukprot:1749979-Lingulodinium_polyedra.AAC.1
MRVVQSPFPPGSPIVRFQHRRLCQGYRDGGDPGMEKHMKTSLVWSSPVQSTPIQSSPVQPHLV